MSKKVAAPQTLEFTIAQAIYNLAAHTTKTFASTRIAKANLSGDLKKRISLHKKNLNDVQRESNELSDYVSTNQFGFNAPTMRKLCRLHDSLETVLANEEVNSLLAQNIEEKRVNGTFQKKLRVLDQIAPAIGALGGVQAGIALTYDNLFGAVAGGVAFTLGLKKYLEMQSQPLIKKPKPLSFQTTIIPTLALQFASSQSYKAIKQITEPSAAENYLSSYSYITNTIGFLCMTAGLFGYVRDFLESQKQKAIENSTETFNRFAKIGIATRFAYENLSYIERVSASEKRDPSDFAEQIDYLKFITTAYIKSAVQIEDLFEARVRYVPKTVQTTPKQPKITTTQTISAKVGYTAEEYKKLRQKRDEERRQENSQNTQLKTQPHENSGTSASQLEHEHYQTPQVYITQHLKKKEDEVIDRFRYGTLCDLITEKIISGSEYNSQTGRFTPIQGANLEVIKKSTTYAKNIIERYRIESSQTTLFRVKQGRAIRAIIGLDSENKFYIYDILKHCDYDNLGK
jgi:hypothetical protein